MQNGAKTDNRAVRHLARVMTDNRTLWHLERSTVES